jgi:hypothetical protein
MRWRAILLTVVACVHGDSQTKIRRSWGFYRGVPATIPLYSSDGSGYKEHVYILAS